MYHGRLDADTNMEARQNGGRNCNGGRARVSLRDNGEARRAEERTVQLPGALCVPACAEQDEVNRVAEPRDVVALQLLPVVLNVRRRGRLEDEALCEERTVESAGGGQNHEGRSTRARTFKALDRASKSCLEFLFEERVFQCQSTGVCQRESEETRTNLDGGRYASRDVHWQPRRQHRPARDDADDLLERRPPLGVRALDERLAVELEDVEEDELEVEVAAAFLRRLRLVARQT